MNLLCFNSHLPKIYQSFLMSATLSEDVQALKELLLHNPVTLHIHSSGMVICVLESLHIRTSSCLVSAF